MRIAVGIAIVLAGLTIGAWIWLGKPAAPVAPAIERSVGHASELAEPVTLQQSELPAAGEVSSPVMRETASLPTIQSELAKPSGTVTLLRVHLLSKEDRSPQQDMRLTLKAADESGSSCSYVAGHRGRLGECPLTDKDGWAEFEVEPGRGHAVDCNELDDRFDGHEVPALAKGEHRELEILVPTQDDVVLFGVLVDAENLRPVADGTLQIQGDRIFSSIHSHAEQPDQPAERIELEGSPVRAGPDGRFQLGGKSWKHRAVSVTAPGYARTAFLLALGHSAAADPLEVRMWRSATLDVVVKDASGAPILGASLKLETRGNLLAQQGVLPDFYYPGDELWSSKTDALGNASLVDLPPRVPLELKVYKKGMGTRAESEPLILEVGERRRIEISWGTGGRVQGQVLDGNGNPVAKRRMWRVPSEPARTRPMILERYGEPAGTTSTDEQGRFQFGDIPVGTWCIGLAPSSARGSSAFPAYAEPVQVRWPGEDVELVLRVDAGLYLRGKVIDPSGAPVRRATVLGEHKGSSMGMQDETDKQGAFKLGPLPRGTWILQALELESVHAPPEPMQVEAGTEGIVLRMQVGASIEGKLVNGSAHESSDCFLVLSRIDEDSVCGTAGAEEGKFKFGGLVPGTYLISARDRTGSIGISREISLAAGQTVKDVEIELLRGAKLRLRYEGEAKYASYTIFSGGSPINFNSLEQGGSAEECVPTGAVEVRWANPVLEVTKTEAITIQVGEVREIVWDGKP